MTQVNSKESPTLRVVHKDRKWLVPLVLAPLAERMAIG